MLNTTLQTQVILDIFLAFLTTFNVKNEMWNIEGQGACANR